MKNPNVPVKPKRGRPKASMGQRIRSKYGKDGRVLLEKLDTMLMADDTPPRERYAIVKELLDRGWGRTAAVENPAETTYEPIFVIKKTPPVEPFTPPES